MQYKHLIYNDFYQFSYWTAVQICVKPIFTLFGEKEPKEGEWHGKLDHSRLGRRHFRCGPHFESQHIESGIGIARFKLKSPQFARLAGFFMSGGFYHV